MKPILFSVIMSAAVVGFTALAMFAATLFWPVSPVYEVRAIDADGGLYVAGSGDSCSSAWIGARYPETVRDIECVRAN